MLLVVLQHLGKGHLRPIRVAEVPDDNDDVFYLFLQKQKVALRHIPFCMQRLPPLQSPSAARGTSRQTMNSEVRAAAATALAARSCAATPALPRPASPQNLIGR